MQEKIIIFSYSKMAMQIAKVLSAKQYSIIIVEKNKKLAKKAISAGYEVKNLSLMKDKNILSLGIADDNSIKAFFCLSDDKNINLFVTLSVRNLNKSLKIISVSFVTEDDKTMLLAGATKVINPFKIGGLRIFRLLHKPLILDILDNILFSESDIEVAEITFTKNSIFDGVYLKDIDLINQHNLILLGMQDKELGDKFIFYSKGINHKIDYDDTLVVLGHSKDLENLKNFVNII